MRVRYPAGHPSAEALPKQRDYEARTQAFLNQRMAPERFVLSASASLPILLIIRAGSLIPIMGSRPVRGRPRFLRRFGMIFG